MPNWIIKLIEVLGKIKMKCKSKCCESSCMLNDENNLDHNIIENAETTTNKQNAIREGKSKSL